MAEEEGIYYGSSQAIYSKNLGMRPPQN